MKKRRSKRSAMPLIFILALAGGMYWGLKHFSPPRPVIRPAVTPPVSTPQSKPAKQKNHELTIYKVVVKDNQATLQPVKVKSVPGKSKYYAALYRLIKEGDGIHTANPMPAGTKLLGVKLKHGLITVDMSKEFRDNFDGGSDGEALTIGAILNTMKQFPEVKRVQILVEGKPLDTLGDLDLSKPLGVDWAGSDFGGGN